MDKPDNFVFNNGSALLKESDTNKSFVKKVQSRVSGLLSTSLSKWFGSDNGKQTTTRHRDEDEDDESYDIQPPSKRLKMPTSESIYANSFPSTYTNDVGQRTSNYTSNAKTLFEPVAGPSGIQSNLELNLLNGDKDSDSGESTDVDSSRLQLNHAETTINRETRNRFNTTAPSSSHNRSLFSDRSSTPQLNTSLSSRRPSFNASTFGSPNFVDQTHSTKRILNSPFYKGRTIYGGASAYSAQNRNAVVKQSSNRIQVKPVNNSTSNDATLSETARRILHALEEFRSPLADAQKVPPPARRSRPEGILSKYTGANPYVKDHKIPLALNKELLVPTVPDLLKMKLKERLQDSTVAVRQIATTSKSVLNKDDYKLRNDDETPKHNNKIKNKITATRQQKPDIPTEEVKLPDIPLPITTLPKFDFSLPPPPSSSKQPLVTVACTDPAKTTELTSKKPEEIVEARADGGNVQYKFSNPLILAENLISIIAINDFKFSDPVFKQKDNNFKLSSDSNIQLKRKVPSEIPQPAVKLHKGSIDEIFNKHTPDKSLDKFKPAAETWECSVCLIRNVPDKLKCIACENSKTQKIPAPKTSFGSAFKMTSDKWECAVCLVRNSNDVSKCVACSNLKPSSDTKVNGPTPTVTSDNSFGNKFKPSSDVWICPTCMIQNKNELQKCAACETHKPGATPSLTSNSFGDSFKKKTDEWECTVCMVRNSLEKKSCVACESPKPGAKLQAGNIEEPQKIPTFNFGILPKTTTSPESKPPAVLPAFSASTPSTTSLSVPTFTFGIPKSEATSIKTSAPPSNVTAGVKPILSNKPSESEIPTKAKIEESKPIVQPEPPKFVTTGGFNFGTFAKPNDEVKTTLTPSKSVESISSKPIITSPTQSAFTFTPSSPALTLKRTLNDADSTTTEAKKEPIAPLRTPIIFSPPKTDTNILKPSVAKPQVSLLNQEKNPFGAVPNSVAPVVTTQTPTPASSSFSFTTPQTQSQISSAPVPVNLFSFGAKTTASSIFGNTTTTTQAPMFKFNQPEQPTFGVAGETQGQSLFGKTPSSIFGITPKATFDTPTSAPPPAFGVTQPSFGTEMRPTPTSAFNSEIKTQPAIPGFGTEIKQPIMTSAFGTDVKPSTTAPTFGNDMKPPLFGTTDMKPFSFVAKPNEEASKLAFSFPTSVAKPPEPAKPAFSFGAPSTQPPAATGGFSFSNNNTNATSAASFNFTSPKAEATSPFQSPAPATNIFNTNLQSQNQTIPNGGFNFGNTPSSNNNMKTGFNFGATNQFNAAPAPAPAAPAVFSFGTNPNPAPVPAAGGFNFVQNAPQASAFNANIKPNFNFTAGNLPATFSATADTPSMMQRRRLKAVRRNPR